MSAATSDLVAFATTAKARLVEALALLGGQDKPFEQLCEALSALDCLKAELELADEKAEASIGSAGVK